MTLTPDLIVLAMAACLAIAGRFVKLTGEKYERRTWIEWFIGVESRAVAIRLQSVFYPERAGGRSPTASIVAPWIKGKILELKRPVADQRVESAHFERIAIAMMSDEQAEASLTRLTSYEWGKRK